jgi:hypothetical protein
VAYFEPIGATRRRRRTATVLCKIVFPPGGLGGRGLASGAEMG